jgi:hypothetical protein
MGLQDTIFDTRADIEENNCDQNTLDRFDEIIKQLGKFEAAAIRADRELLEIRRAATVIGSLFGRK